MELEFLTRIRKTSILFGLFISPFIATYSGPGAAAGWFAGIAWSLLNIYLITGLVRAAGGRERSQARTLMLGLAKFPLLYYAGYLILACGVFPVMSLVAGFTWPFVVTTLKALGRMLLHLDGSGGRLLEKGSDAGAGAGDR